MCRMSDKEKIDKWLEEHDGDDHCEYCIYGNECKGLTYDSLGPVEPPCCSTDIEELLDTEAILMDISEESEGEEKS